MACRHVVNVSVSVNVSAVTIRMDVILDELFLFIRLVGRSVVYINSLLFLQSNHVEDIFYFHTLFVNFTFHFVFPYFV